LYSSSAASDVYKRQSPPFPNIKALLRYSTIVVILLLFFLTFFEISGYLYIFCHIGDGAYTVSYTHLTLPTMSTTWG
ncbi:hypothetical protein, partial [Bacillus pumilus]|uniref:hypothetical protein n=1 Tax=Bacillus pumilus TaxID=1408 RepID=UPI001C99178D